MGNRTFPSAKQHLNISPVLIRLPCIMWLWPNLQVQRDPISWEYIRRSKMSSWLHQLRSLCRVEWLWNENVPQWEKMKRDHYCPWWLSEDIKWTKQFLLANQMWFPGNSGTHCGETRLLVPGSKSRSNIASPFAEVGTWPQIEWMVVILPIQSQCLLPDTAYVLTDTFTINSWINFINLFI